jgi:c-di-GMP-binding flagellar brake protein YcgR
VEFLSSCDDILDRSKHQVGGIDRRRFGRIDLFASLQGEVTLRQPIQITDVSASGMRIATSSALNRNAQYEFRLTVDDRSFVALGRVVHTSESRSDEGRGVFLAGIEFLDVSEASQAILNDFINLMRLAESKINIQEKPAAGASDSDPAAPATTTTAEKLG